MIPEAEYQRALAQHDPRGRGYLERIRRAPNPALNTFIRDGLQYDKKGGVNIESNLEYNALFRIVRLDPVVRRRAFTLSSGYLARVVSSIVDAPPQPVSADTDTNVVGAACRIHPPAWLGPLQQLLEANWNLSNDPKHVYDHAERVAAAKYLIEQCPRVVQRLYDDRLLVRGCVRTGEYGPVRALLALL